MNNHTKIWKLLNGGRRRRRHHTAWETPGVQTAADRIPEDMAEVLEALWTLEERGGASIENVSREADTHVTEKVIEDLLGRDLIVIEEGSRIRLARAGREMAEQIIRRHRLAERLICDVLGAHVDESEDAACEFEHILAEGITNSICTLLGHPRFCPHNRPIPPGECCRHAEETARPVLVPTAQLDVGEEARIAYLSTSEHARMLKLSSLGISPGSRIRLLQKWPAYVVQCDETEIALEADVAQNIYVRRSSSE